MKTNHIHSKALTIQQPWEAVLLRIIFGGLLILAGAYLYFVISSILNVMAQREAQLGSQHIQNSISALEGTYFTLTKSVTPEDGIALGLASINKPLYVTRPGTVGSAQTNNTGAL